MAEPQVEPGWKAVLADAFAHSQMASLRAFLVEEKRRHTVFPPGPEMFAAFNLTPFERVRVVILGQDPYMRPGQAHGLCFSVRPGVPVPPSLRNIQAELQRDLGIQPAADGDLRRWAEQGVLLLNALLTVREGEPMSHANQGWERFTDAAVHALAKQREGLVFLLWGRHAQAKAAGIDAERHLILKASHPSPMAVAGFRGCGHFSKTNAYLESRGSQPIRW